MKRVIKAAKVTDYIDADMLHKWMENPNFGEVSSYRQLDDMIVETVEEVYNVFQGTESATKRRYWKFVRGDEGWEAYEVDKYGDRLRNSRAFLLG